MASHNNSVEIQHPPGYVERTFPVTAVRESDPKLMRQRSWNIALGPLRQVPMNLFIMWISGDSISLFPLVSIVMIFLRPLQALFTAQSSKHDFIKIYTYFPMTLYRNLVSLRSFILILF